MAIILTRNFDGSPVTDFPGEVRKRAAAAAATGAFDFIYIVPTRRRVRELQRELVTDVTFGKLPVYTLELFAREIFLLMSTGNREITPSMQGMLAGRVLAENDFRFFRYASFRPGTRKGAAPVGTIKKIVDQIDYLEENGITPEDYRIMASAAEDSERLKLEEFATIYSEYMKQLGDRLIDSGGILSLVNAGLDESRGVIDERFPGSLTVFVEGFYSFKKPELDFLRLFSSDARFRFLIKLDCDESNVNLFRTMISTSEDLAARGFRIQEGVGEEEANPERLRGNFFASSLFADDRPEEKPDLGSEVFVIGVRDSLRETEFVAEKIKEIVKENPAQKLDRICVASYLPQNYSRMFREVFRKYRLPSNITDRYTLESNNVVNAILSFIDIKAADYERVTLMRAVTNRIMTVSGEFGPDAAGSILYNAARLCRFERGLKVFRDSIDSRLEFMKRLGNSDPDNDERRTIHDTILLKKARRILSEIEEKLSGFNSPLDPAEFRQRIRRLVNMLAIQKNIVRVDAGGISTELVERDARALSAFFEVLDEVVEVEIERGGNKLSVPEWLEHLRSALSLTRYNIRQKYGYGVYVTSLEEIRGLEFDYLFIVGLNEGELPAKYNPEIFLPLKSQEENRKTEPYLQRHLFYQAISSFRKEVYLVHPLLREEVRLVRSSFIDAITSIARVTELEDCAGEAGVRNIYNVHQLIESESASASAQGRVAADIDAVSLLPPNLDRCRTAEASRYRGDTESEFAGRITDRRLLSGLEETVGAKVFSAAQIESLARCGFQYFTGRILRIAETPEIETSLSPIERGAVLHKILYRFYSELSKKDRLGAAKDELELLLAVARDVLDGLGIAADGSFGHDLFEIERETIIGTAEIPGTLQLFLEKVQSKLSEYGFIPGRFEVGFGMKGENGEETDPVEIGGVQIRGKIDRIDAGKSGLTIFDYKTSSVNATHREVIRERINPQLLIYLSALNKLMESSDTSEYVSGAAYISINRNRLLKAESGSDLIEFIVHEEDGTLRFNRNLDSSKKTPSASGYPETMNTLLKETESFVGEKVAAAKSGRFNLTEFPPQKVCRYCPYIEACRIALTGEGIEEMDEAE